MKKIIFIVTFLSSLVFYSQENVNLKKSQLKINILTPGLVYEFAISKKTTIYSEFNTGILYKYSNTFGAVTAINFNINEQFRYYYNLDKRLLQSKSIKNNSANYFALNISNSFKPFAGKNIDKYLFYNTFYVGPVIGFQRNYKSNFNLDMNFGLGATVIQNNNKPVIPIINFSLGWVIF